MVEMATNDKINKKEERTFIVECIQLYQSLPALWNVKSSDYSNKIKKNEQYEQLVCKYKEKYPDADKSQVVKKFNSLRTNFRKELKRIKDSEKSGAGISGVIEPTLWYFDEMKFLISDEVPSISQNSIWTEYIKEENENYIDDVDVGTNRINGNTVPPTKKARKLNDEGELISPVRKHLEQPQTDYDIIAAAWAVELQKMTPKQQLFAKKAINDILFEGQMGTLHRDSVQINFLDTV